MTDFGIPKVIGGNFKFATDVSKRHGQQAFRTVPSSAVLLTPAVLTFGIDWLVQRKQTAMLGARAVPYRPKPARGFDVLMLAYVGFISALMLAIVGMAIFASFATYWPYNLAPSFKHYTMGLVDAEVGTAFLNSLSSRPERRLRHAPGLAGATCSRNAGCDTVRPSSSCSPCCLWPCRGGVGARAHLLFNAAGNPLTACTTRCC